jgi:hypothetical protein
MQRSTNFATQNFKRHGYSDKVSVFDSELVTASKHRATSSQTAVVKSKGATATMISVCLI